MWDVRPETPEDFAAIRAVHLGAFAPSEVEAKLVDALRASDAHLPDLCLVALRDSVIAGHVAFSRAQLDSGAPVLALGPMGVLPEHQGKDAGSALVREGLVRSERTDFALVVVVGHAGYYPRFGFESARELGLESPFPVPDEAWMAYRLPAYRPDARGMVAYADAFADLA